MKGVKSYVEPATRIEKYLGATIELLPSGWYSAFIINRGFLKADTLQGIKSLIREAKMNEVNLV